MIADFNLCLREMALAKAEKEADHERRRRERFDALKKLAEEADQFVDQRKRLDLETANTIRSLGKNGVPVSKIIKEFEAKGVSPHSIKYYAYLGVKERKAMC